MTKDTINLKYNNRNIELSYSGLPEEEPWMMADLKEVTASGEGDYTKAEQEAQLYLIKKAINQSTHFHKLEKIIGVRQNIISLDENSNSVKIVLEGFGVFR